MFPVGVKFQVNTACFMLQFIKGVKEGIIPTGNKRLYCFHASG